MSFKHGFDPLLWSGASSSAPLVETSRGGGGLKQNPGPVLEGELFF